MLTKADLPPLPIVVPGFIKRRCLDAARLLDERMRHYYSTRGFRLRTWLAGFKDETRISLQPDQPIYVDKWQAKDLIEQTVKRLFLDAPSRQRVVLQRALVSKATA